MTKSPEKPVSGTKPPKLGLKKLPKVKIGRSIAKAISWRVLGTTDTLILSFVLITFLGPIFGLKPSEGEALETASLIAITEVVTKMVLYFLHERVWNKLKWGASTKDGDRSESYRRSGLKTASWRIIASIDTIALAWFYTGNFATAISIGGLEVFTKLILYFVHERIWTKIPFGLQHTAEIEPEPTQPQ